MLVGGGPRRGPHAIFIYIPPFQHLKLNEKKPYGIGGGKILRRDIYLGFILRLKRIRVQKVFLFRRFPDPNPGKGLDKLGKENIDATETGFVGI